MNIATKGHRGGGIEVESHTCECWANAGEALGKPWKRDCHQIFLWWRWLAQPFPAHDLFQMSIPSLILCVISCNVWPLTHHFIGINHDHHTSSFKHPSPTDHYYWILPCANLIVCIHPLSTLIFIHLPSKMTPQRPILSKHAFLAAFIPPFGDDSPRHSPSFHWCHTWVMIKFIQILI